MSTFNIQIQVEGNKITQIIYHNGTPYSDWNLGIDNRGMVLTFSPDISWTPTDWKQWPEDRDGDMFERLKE